MLASATSTRRRAILVGLGAALIAAAAPAQARVETLRWTHPDDAAVTGFRVHWGEASLTYPNTVEAGKPTPDAEGVYQFDLSVPDDLTVYVAVSAYNSSTQSPYSNERVRAPDSTTGDGTGGSDPGSDPPSDVPAGTTIPEDANAIWYESFEQVSLGTAVTSFVDTGAGNSLSENDALFSAVDGSGNIALATTSTGTNIHSHYLATGTSDWQNYEYRGRLLITDTNAGAGVTAYSRYTSEDVYYRMRRYDGSPSFHLAMHPDPGLSCSDADTGVAPSANTWYEFALRVTTANGADTIRAKIWPQGAAEPTSWQASCTNPSSRVAGAVGVWSMGPGAKYWDDLQVIDLGSQPPASDDPTTDDPEPLGQPGQPTLVQ